MSEAPHEGHSPKGTKKTEMGGSGEINADSAQGSTGGVMEGDIGNPPKVGNFTQISGGEHKEEQEQEKDKQASPAPPPSSPPPPSSSPTPAGPVDMEVRRGSSPVPPPSSSQEDESLDSESTNSTVDSSPAPSKRAMVMSGREHEETDDFLLSTMLAIRTAVLAGTKDATKLEATAEDFCASIKHKISMAGDRKVEVKDYAPVVFTLLRRHFGVSIPSYLLSWSDSRLAKSKSAGKSDSMFIMSPDNKFVLKTLVREEAKRLCKILRPYYEHMIENKDTFMSRIYGLHRMSRRRGQSSIYFAIFNNVFDSGLPLSEIYDLKGSTVGRRASSETPVQRRSSTSFEFRQVRKAITEEQAQPPKKPTVLKDLDFTRKLHIGPENRAKVLAQLGRDCKFLAHHQLMDYSLLIGIRRTDTPNGATQPRSESPTPLAHSSTPVSSPSSDQRVVPVKNGMPIIVPSSPRARHSIQVVPSSAPETHRARVPGLLFFLESTKAATSKSLRETKRDRRKSVSEGGGNALIQQELIAIDEEEAEENRLAALEAQKSADATTTTSPTTTSPTTHENTKPTHESTPTHTPPTHDTPPTHASPTPNGTSETPTIKIDPAADDDDEPEGTPPEITVIPPPSPIASHGEKGVKTEKSEKTGNDDDSGNSGEVGAVVVPPLKIASIDGHMSPSSNGNGDACKDDASDDSSLMDSPNNSPRHSLGMLTVNSVPDFNYFVNGQNPAAPSGVATNMPKSGSSSLRVTSAGNTPTMKRNHRSASLNYVNLDPLCGSPYIPFYKNTDGGLPGATFVPLDSNKSNEVYYIGLIDFLQKYNKKKKLAGFAKSLKYEKEELSTVDPNFYMERFIKMTERAIVE